MATRYYDSAGYDFDDVFDSYVEGSKPALTGYRTADGTDLAERFAPLSFGSKRGDINYRISSGADVTNLWAMKGTAQYVRISLPNIFIAGTTAPPIGGAHASFEFRPDGSVWTYKNDPQAMAIKLDALWISDSSRSGEYEMRVSKLSGDTTTNDIGVWRNLGSLLSWGFDNRTIDTTVSCYLLLEVRKSGTSTILATSNASLSGNYSDGSVGEIS